MIGRWGRVVLIVLVLLLLPGWEGHGQVASAAEAGLLAAPEAEAAQQIRAAQRTQRSTRGTLRVPGGGVRCAEARFISYKRSDREPDVVDQWYVVSQLWADAALLAVDGDNPKLRAEVRSANRQARTQQWDEDDARCHLDKGFVFLDRLWDEEEGGYYPRSNQTGSRISDKAQYADDNALAGLALLAAAESADDGFSRDYYIYAAVLEAQYLQESGLWDDTFGGGFWWSTGLGDSEEGKPAQTNALAALFFARLYGVTGDPAHLDAAVTTLGWLDEHLFDEQRNLYRWSIRYEHPAERAGGPVRSDRYFNYDQSIAIEALLAMAAIDGDKGKIARARAIGDSLHTAFWGKERGGYNLEMGVEQVYTSYAAWTGMGHLALYAENGDDKWLRMARANAHALASTTGEADGGYALRHYPCRDRRAAGCTDGRTTWVVDRTRDTAAQAWAQHLQVALAQSMMRRRPT